jgi:two-component system sensor histidine kinase/response regulator
MNGKIWLESQYEKGSSFIFEIELEKLDKKELIIEKEEIDSKFYDSKIFENSNILLAEDNRINQDIIVSLLEKSALNIDIAFDGQDALNKYNKNKDKYDLILMDIQMPVMDGYEASTKIREENKNIPIIALSANTFEKDIKKAKEMGMNEHLSKPIDIDKLYAILSKYLSIENTNLDSKTSSFQNIDKEKGIYYIGGDEKLYMKVLDKFYNDYIDMEFEKLSKDELKITVHTLKGLSLSIGANNLYEKVKVLNETLDNKAIPAVNDELKEVLDEIKSL